MSRYRGYIIDDNGETVELYTANDEPTALDLHRRHGGLLDRVSDGAAWAGGDAQWIDDNGITVA